MARNIFIILAILITQATTVVSQAVSFEPGPQEKAVTLTGVLEHSVIVPGGVTRAAFKGKVAPEFHIQSNRPLEDWIIPTALEIKAPPQVRVRQTTYPPAQLKSFAFNKKKKLSVFGNNPVFMVTLSVADDAKAGRYPIEAKLSYQACNDSQCLPPEDVSVTVTMRVGEKTSQASTDPVFSTKAPYSDNPAETTGSSNRFSDLAKKRGLGVLLLAVYAAGLLLSLTPCVFPLIPITIGYFRGQASDSRSRTIGLAIAYVFGIATTYSVLGVVAASTGALFGAWLAHPAVLIVFAAIIGAMALSMFGYYDLRPPSFIAGKSGAKSGYTGAFLMGLLFGVIAAPCTGPATIALLAFVASLAKPLAGFFLFFTLAIGISTPLLGLAIFSGNLPKSGVWMEWVKKAMGALMLAAAIWFLGPLIGDKALHLAWGILALAMGIWLGFIEKSGFKPSSLAVTRAVLGAAAILLGALLLIPKPEQPGIVWEEYSQEKVSQAAAEDKPVMLDFYADWCAPCKELQAGAFRDPSVIKLSNKFIRLHVDLTQNSAGNDAIRKRFKVSGVPAILFIGKNGKEVPETRIETNVPGKVMLQSMEKALSQP